MKKLKLSSLPRTWLLDIDGTLVVHNGHLKNNETLLEGVKEFFARIGKKDKVILLTSRGPEYGNKLKRFLKQNRIPFDQIVYDLPYGERILVNDRKPSGLKTAYAMNKKRDARLDITFEVDEGL
jgi:ribonucleotide monophosphatase NagD (HAD superfamily)